MKSHSITYSEDYTNKILPGLSPKHEHNRDVVKQRPQQPHLEDGIGLQDIISPR